MSTDCSANQTSPNPEVGWTNCAAVSFLWWLPVMLVLVLFLPWCVGRLMDSWEERRAGPARAKGQTFSV
jgi:hypothetical protein